MGEVPGSIPGTALLVFSKDGYCNLFLNEKSNVSAARLAQLVEREALNLVVVGSSPTVGGFYLVF